MNVLWVRHLGSDVWHVELKSYDRDELIARSKKVLKGTSVADTQIQPEGVDPNTIKTRR